MVVDDIHLFDGGEAVVGGTRGGGMGGGGVEEDIYLLSNGYISGGETSEGDTSDEDEDSTRNFHYVDWERRGAEGRWLMKIRGW